MRILAIESSAVTASVAILEDDTLVAEYTFNHKMTHSQTLLPMIDEIFSMVQLKPDDVDVIAVSKGPDSFTGLRIGAATGKGIALALDKKMVAVPTLAAMAYNLYGDSRYICPVMDARRKHLYSGIYTFDGDRLITVTDVNNKEFSMDVPGNAAGTVFDDSNNDGQSAAGAGTAKTISQEVTDVGTMSIHVGANQDQVIVIDIPAITTYSLGTEHMNVMTQYTASRAISTVDEAINKTNEIRSRIGAYENRFDHTTNNLEVSSENLTKSLSTMIDTDMSEEMTTYTSETVLTQAATSILAQANERPSQVLQLLQ